MTSINQKRRAEIGEQKRARTLEHLIDSAMECFATSKIEATTTAHICQAAKVSRGTFYNYFDDMDDLIIAVLKKSQNSVEANVTEQTQDITPGPERLAAAMKKLYRQAKHSPTLAKMFLFAIESRQHQKYEDAFKSDLLADIRAGQQRNLITLNDETIALDIVHGTISRGMKSLLRGRINHEQTPLYVERVLVALGIPQQLARQFAHTN